MCCLHGLSRAGGAQRYRCCSCGYHRPLARADVPGGGQVGKRCLYGKADGLVCPGGPRPVPEPDWIDYNMWLGPAPYVPYTNDRCSNSLWWFISDYALGFIAGWGIHPVDIAIWGGGAKVKTPLEVEGKGGRSSPGGGCETG